MLIIPAGLPLERQYRPAGVPRRRRLSSGHQMVGAGAFSAGAARPDAARLSRVAQRQGRAGDGRDSERGLRGRVQGRARLHAGAGAAQRARSGRDPAGGAHAARGQEPRAVGRPGRALCARPASGWWRWPSSSRRRWSPPIRAKARSRRAIRWRSAHRPARGRRCSPSSWRSADLVLAIGSSLTKTPFGPGVPPGKTIIHATNDAGDINKEYRPDQAVVGDAALVLDALIDEVGRQKGARRRQRARRAEGRGRRRQESLARRMGEASRLRRDADQPVPRDPRPDAHRRPRQHHHHARLRQPARADDAVLGDDRGRLLHGLGQVDPARLRPRHHHGRQAGGTRQALRQYHGRLRRSA